MIASLVLGRYQFLLTSCQEYVRKGLRPATILPIGCQHTG
jgi:hypothetical protein